MNRIVIRRTILVVAACVWFAPASAEVGAPTTDEIAAALGNHLPSFWSIKEVETVATINDGDAIDPRYRQRFVATAVPREKLFSEAVRNTVAAPYIVVIETFNQKQSHNLYGVVSSTLKLGKRNFEFRMENGTEGLGLPLAMYSRPTIIAGSKQATESMEKLSAAQQVIKVLAEQSVRAEADAVALQAAADEELNLLRKENGKRLEALIRRYDQERAAIKATQETLTAIAEAKAEISSLEELSAVQQELVAKRKVSKEQQQALLAQEIEEESERRAALFQTLRSENAEERKTGFNVMFASGDEELNLMALKEAFASEDKNLKAHAITVAMKSGTVAFRELALASWVAEKPEIVISMYSRDGRKYRGVLYFEVLSISEDQRLAGKMKMHELEWYSEGTYSVSKRNDGTGVVHRDRISLRGPFSYQDDPHFCAGELGPNDEGILVGIIKCDRQKANLGVVDIWSMGKKSE